MDEQRAARRRRARRREVRRRRLVLVVAALLSLGAGFVTAADSPEPDAPAPTPDAPVRFTVAASGDLLIHGGVYRRAWALGAGRRYDFAPMFRYVRPDIEGADLALCHVETPMTSAPPAGYPLFNTPPALARAIKSTGWDVCSTASNHSLDRGQRGVAGTLEALERAGVAHTGTARSSAERRRIPLLEAKGVKVAFLAYTEMTNGIPRPYPWSVNLAAASAILADAQRARRLGAKAVIVNLHWGIEYRHAPSSFQLALARRLTRSPHVTAVVGQHAHVVQPIRRINGKLVVFGEGNLVSNQTAACCPAASQDGLIALLQFAFDGARARVESIRYVPTWVRHPDYTVVPIDTGLRERLAPPSTLRRSYRRTVSAAGRGPDYGPRPARLP